MKHILLAGDSIFDNEHYLRANELSVSKHLIRKMPKDKISLIARDGAKINDVIRQLNKLPLESFSYPEILRRKVCKDNHCRSRDWYTQRTFAKDS